MDDDTGRHLGPDSGLGAMALTRRPVDPAGTLRAWDAADALLLGALAAVAQPKGAAGTDGADGADGAAPLIVDDAFGALSVALRHRAPVSWADSAVAHLAMQHNLRAQGDGGSVVDVADPQALTGPFRTIVWRLPNAVRALRFQASVIQRVAAPGALVIAGGMDRHLPPTRNALEQLGSVRMHPGVRKAHVFEVVIDADRPPVVPLGLPEVEIPELGLTLVGGQLSYSPDRLDPGARVMTSAMTSSLPAVAGIGRVADLCCGGGVLGMVAQRLLPTAQVEYFDASWSAVDAARRNVQRNGAGGAPESRFHWNDGMHAYDGPPFDLIVCNPPFHQRGALTDAVAWQLFVDARHHLRRGGELWVVGNRHLGYHVKLARLFGRCRQVAAHPKFVVLAATRS